jgi:hypothetical protein
MNFKQWIFNEMPITKFQLMGQWGPDAKRAYGYNRQDVGILTSPKGVEKIHRKWNNTHFNFDLYFLRSNEARKHREVGLVEPAWVKQNLGEEITPNPDAITIIFTQNLGAEKIPMTAWTIAHRLGHAIRRDKIFEDYLANELRKDFNEILSNVYGSRVTMNYWDSETRQRNDKELLALAKAVGTMQSARRGQLVRFEEFIYEIVAQWIITGKVRFKELPRSLITRKRMAWGRPAHDTKNSRVNQDEHEEWSNMLTGLGDKYEHYLDSIFTGLVGKMYVM